MAEKQINSLTLPGCADTFVFSVDQEHLQNKQNPHGVTAEQVGAIPIEEKGKINGIASLDGSGKVLSAQLPEMNYDPKGSASEVQTKLSDHIKDESNPHNVTAAQVKFSDGESFQQKLDKGVLKGQDGVIGHDGAPGEKGEPGPAGKDGLTTTIAINGENYKHVNGTITLPDYPTLSTLGLTASAAELNYCAGVTSDIQAQIDGKTTETYVNNAVQNSCTAVSFGTIAPENTKILWIDTTADTGGLKYYNGTAWVHVPVAYTT